MLDSLGVRVITYDRPGYGRSDRQPGRNVADTAADVAAIADAAGLERFAVEGASSGSAHALAVAALLGQRVMRVACVAPMAPLEKLGLAEWSRGQDPEVRAYVARCLEGVDGAAEVIAGEDEAMRHDADRANPSDASVFEATRPGIWGWVDDELAVLKPWGFDPGAIDAPTAIWYDPDETVLPAQHATWLASRIPHAVVATTAALGHRAIGEPREDWASLYSWLTAT